MHLELLSTDHCSLCEQALDLLLSMPDVAGLRLEVIDIAADDQLYQKYGESIPVLRLQEHELAAPFDRAAIVHWLKEIAQKL